MELPGSVTWFDFKDMVAQVVGSSQNEIRVTTTARPVNELSIRGRRLPNVVGVDRDSVAPPYGVFVDPREIGMSVAFVQMTSCTATIGGLLDAAGAKYFLGLRFIVQGAFAYTPESGRVTFGHRSLLTVRVDTEFMSIIMRPLKVDSGGDGGEDADSRGEDPADANGDRTGVAPDHPDRSRSPRRTGNGGTALPDRRQRGMILPTVPALERRTGHSVRCSGVPEAHVDKSDYDTALGDGILRVEGDDTAALYGVCGGSDTWRPSACGDGRCVRGNADGTRWSPRVDTWNPGFELRTADSSCLWEDTPVCQDLVCTVIDGVSDEQKQNAMAAVLSCIQALSAGERDVWDEGELIPSIERRECDGSEQVAAPGKAAEACVSVVRRPLPTPCRAAGQEIRQPAFTESPTAISLAEALACERFDVQQQCLPLMSEENASLLERLGNPWPNFRLRTTMDCLQLKECTRAALGLCVDFGSLARVTLLELYTDGSAKDNSSGFAVVVVAHEEGVTTRRTALVGFLSAPRAAAPAITSASSFHGWSLWAGVCRHENPHTPHIASQSSVTSRDFVTI